MKIKICKHNFKPHFSRSSCKKSKSTLRAWMLEFTKYWMHSCLSWVKLIAFWWYFRLNKFIISFTSPLYIIVCHYYTLSSIQSQILQLMCSLQLILWGFVVLPTKELMYFIKPNWKDKVRQYIRCFAFLKTFNTFVTTSTQKHHHDFVKLQFSSYF